MAGTLFSACHLCDHQSFNLKSNGRLISQLPTIRHEMRKVVECMLEGASVALGWIEQVQVIWNREVGNLVNITSRAQYEKHSHRMIIYYLEQALASD